ncbi:MAG: L,D-transpeptidase, partial [Chloroflexota bacterium]|nr:L,D-transpeptidase [Chloroflexota bacterium]
SKEDLSGRHQGDEAYWNGNFPSKWIDINLTSQSIAAYQGGTQVRTSLVTTGRPELPTPTGVYSILAKRSPYTFISPWPKDSEWWYPDSETNFAMLFRSGGFYIHDAPWRYAYGPGTNGSGPRGGAYTGSHGCVNVPYAMMAFLYSWSDVGTPVVIHN